MQTQRIVVALMYAVSAIVAAFQATGVPQTVEAWVGLLMAGVVAFWGKYSSNTTLVAADRAPWSEAERKQAALDAINGK